MQGLGRAGVGLTASCTVDVLFSLRQTPRFRGFCESSLVDSGCTRHKRRQRFSSGCQSQHTHCEGITKRARGDLNPRHQDPESCALSGLSYGRVNATCHYHCLIERPMSRGTTGIGATCNLLRRRGGFHYGSLMPADRNNSTVCTYAQVVLPRAAAYQFLMLRATSTKSSARLGAG